MLAFKNNIYHSQSVEPATRLDPYAFLLHALTADRNVLAGLLASFTEENAQKVEVLFPHASRFASLPILNTLSKNLLAALVRQDQWYRMNAYHLCYLYDSLYGLVEDYSYENRDQRIEMFPELQGEAMPFEEFLAEYFDNTAFLIDPERLNALSSDEKKARGFEDPCLFGVVNKFIPSNEEIALEVIADNPYQTPR